MTENTHSDDALLKQWLATRSEAAFRTLVGRYAGLVHMAALRTCGDASLAAEAAQNTFITLAEKAGTLASRKSLAGWLHLTAVMQAKNLHRKQLRDTRKIERFHMQMDDPTPEKAAIDWGRLSPLLDEALSTMSAQDREALLLRFYRSLSIQEVATTLGIAHAAAQKRVNRATGEKRYLDLCRFFLEERGHLHGTERRPFTEVIPRGDPERLPGELMRDWRRKKWSMRNGRMQDHKPVLEQTEAVGHAVRAGYMYAAMADLARFSGAPEYAKAARTLWEDVVTRKMYVNGGIGTAQYGDEGFGDPYLLPNKTYCESCSAIANVFWQHRMNLLEGDSKYADVMELVLYNAALSGMSLDGDSFFYQNPLESENGSERQPWIGLACCPANLARFTPQVGGFVYATDAKRLHVNLYAAGEASIAMGDGRLVKLRQDTNYPWDGKVKLTVTPENAFDFDLCLRIPAWALGHPVPGDLYRYDSPESSPVTLSVNGQPVDATPQKNGYVQLKRSWKAGDVVELELPMPIRRVYSNEKITANMGKVSLMRGPVVYCLEGPDNKDMDLFKLALPRNSELSATHRPDLLGGVTVIQGDGLDAHQQPVKLTAIPYYAWANRGKSPMNLWINEAK